ncbi:heat stress transcription factor A-4a-like [Raphanus sativus]|uniref:Heat stress transcription factor A-4a-like n=1 Tax=Raphanus sativus TaxID=3726 RepID=A0A6J0NS08_RAPSA|nr:heat stress transcription factor A-4a-like [Raphanus sativus]
MHVPVTVTDDSLSSFYKGLYAVVDDPSLDSVVSWSKDKKSFVIWDPIEFQRRVLPQRRILSLNFSLFMADLKYYGFIRVKGSKHRYHIGHPKYFVRGKPALMKKMQEERIHKFEQARAMRKKAKARAMELADSLGGLAL